MKTVGIAGKRLFNAKKAMLWIMHEVLSPFREASVRQMSSNSLHEFQKIDNIMKSGQTSGQGISDGKQMP